MKYTPEQKNILLDCKVINPDESLVQVNLRWPPPPATGALGVGPKLEQKAIDEFLAVDPTNKWTRWIFHQAAGGPRGVEGSKQTLIALNKRFMEERTGGYLDEETNIRHEPIPKLEAEARWQEAEPIYKEFLHFAHQDVVDKAGGYGFYRHWPGGPSTLYLKVVDAVRNWLEVQSRVPAMNEELTRAGQLTIGEDPSDYETVDDLVKATGKVTRFFASKIARDDIRAVTVYKSDTLQVTVPLTYAASVRYGFEKWNWSDPKQFENRLTSESVFNDPWKTATSKGVYAFFKIHGATPSWVVRNDEKFHRCYLANLCLQININKKNGRPPLEACPVFNEENDGSWTLERVREVIRDEPTRLVEETEEMPVVRGGRAYQTKVEADAVITELNRAVVALDEWLRTFDTSQIVTDCLKLPKPQEQLA